MMTTRLAVDGAGTCEWCGRTLVEGVWERQREHVGVSASDAVTMCPDCVLQVKLETTAW